MPRGSVFRPCPPARTFPFWGSVYWAIAETLGMAGTAALVLAVIFALPSACVLFIAVRMAYEAETDPANQ